MAISQIVALSGNSGTTTTVYTTGSYTPAANRLLLLHISAGLSGAAAAPSSVAGNGLTWTKVADLSTGNSNVNSSLWTAWSGASPTTGALTITFAVASANCGWRVLAFDDTNAAPRGAIKSLAATSTTPAVTLDSAPLATSATVGILNYNAAAAQTMTPGSGFTKIGTDIDVSGSPANQMSAAWDSTTPGTTVDYTTSNLSGKVLFGLELVQRLAISITNPTRTDVAHASTVNMAATATFGTTTGRTYAWTQLTGPAVTLSGSTTATASFTQPADSTTRTFRVTVTDSSGQTATADASITGAVVADPPIADAGADQTNLEPYTTATVPGSATVGTPPYTYAWTQLSGPAVTILNPSTATASFVVPAQVTPVAVVLRLTVTDDADLTDTDDVSLTALPWDLWHRSGGAWLPRPPLQYRAGGSWVP